VVSWGGTGGRNVAGVPDDAVDAPAGSTRPRPILNPWQVAAWMAELMSVPAGLIDAHLPGSSGIGARTREQLILAVSEVNGCRHSAWVHGSWLDFLGRRDPDETLAPLFDYAQACARAGVPLDTTVLDAAFPAAVVRSVRATVARAELANLVGNTVDDLIDQVRGRQSRSPVAALQDLCGLAASLPALAPTALLAGAMKVVARLAPELPAVETPEPTEANLVVHLLAEAAPSYLGHALVRTGLVWSPIPVAIAFRMDGTSATVRLGRGRVIIDNGIAPDAIVVVDGGADALVQTVAGSILRDMGVPTRRPG
jgi:AhpD family alkylhydroperoxidase